MKTAAYGLMALIAAAGCGGEMTAEVHTSEQAVVGSNGIKYNGIKYNSATANGIKYNGIKYNGMGFGSVSFPGATGGTVSGVSVDKTTLRGTLPSGQTISGTQFAGATMVGAMSDGSTITLGISAVKPTADPEILHYALTVWNAATSTWTNACEGGGNAIPVAGVWASNGAKTTSTTDFTFACLNVGAIAKCVQMGYKPWTHDMHHRSCVRMVRGDYCGTGRAYTTDGNVINVFDKIGKQADDHLMQTNYLWYFDAEWGPNGATCITSLATRPKGSGIDCQGERFGNGGFCNSSTTNFASGVYLKNYWGQKLF